MLRGKQQFDKACMTAKQKLSYVRSSSRPPLHGPADIIFDSFFALQIPRFLAGNSAECIKASCPLVSGFSAVRSRPKARTRMMILKMHAKVENSHRLDPEWKMAALRACRMAEMQHAPNKTAANLALSQMALNFFLKKHWAISTCILRCASQAYISAI